MRMLWSFHCVEIAETTYNRLDDDHRIPFLHQMHYSAFMQHALKNILVYGYGKNKLFM